MTFARRDLAIGAALVTVALLLRFAFRYVGGFGDANTIHMAVGVTRGVAGETTFGATLEYAKNLSLGVYLLAWVVKPMFGGATSVVIPAMNAAGLLIGSLLYLPLYRLYRIRFTPSVAGTATALVLLAPVTWEAETYFQPIVPAFFFTLLAALAFRNSLNSSRAGAWLALSTLAASAALLTRAEVFLLIPACLVWGFGRACPRRVALVLAGAGTICALVLAAFATGSEDRSADLGPYVRAFLGSYIRPRFVVRNLIWATLGVGVGSILAACAAPLRCRSGRMRLEVVTAIVLVSTVLIFWVWNPVPLVRHFYLIVPALAWLVADLLLKDLRPRQVVVLGVLIATTNLLLPEGLYAAARAQGMDPTPHGTFFSWHALKAGQVRRALEFSAEVVEASRRSSRMAMWVDWERAGYVQQALLEAGRGGEIEDSTAVPPGVLLRRWRGPDYELLEVGCGWLGDPVARRVIADELLAARAAGATLVIPEDAQPVLAPALAP